MQGGGAAPWQEFWAGGGKVDQALGGETQRIFLSRRWTQFFSSVAISPSPVIVDLAAGAGAIFRIAAPILRERACSPAFVAVDAAFAAAAARREARHFLGVAANAALLPIADAAAEIVVSQFGVEYAGEAAFAEAARILAPSGAFCAVAHYRGGAIEAECAENARLMAAAGIEALTACARKALAAAYERSRKSKKPLVDEEAEASLRNAMAQAIAGAEAAPESAAKTALARFLGDLARLCVRRFAYEPDEALAWIDAMAAALSAYRRRMEAMQRTALDERRIEAIARNFAASGFAVFSARPTAFIEGGPPAAWTIEARRAA